MNTTTKLPLDLLVDNADTWGPFEDAVRDNPYNVDTWVDYLDQIEGSSSSTAETATDSSADKQQKDSLYDWTCRRALVLLPRSYKLWKMHWEHVRKRTAVREEDDDDLEARVLSCLERAVLTMGSYPRVWEVYLEYLCDRVGCCSVTHLRRTINRALSSVAVVQHHKLWPTILRLLLEQHQSKTQPSGATSDNDCDTTSSVVVAAPTVLQRRWNIPVETIATLLSRYARYHPPYLAEYSEWLADHGLWGRAAVAYQQLYNNNNTSHGTAATATTTAETMQSFVQLVTQHPVEVTAAGVPWEAMLRAQLPAVDDDDGGKGDRDHQSTRDTLLSSNLLPQGLIWTSLADAWVRQGLFDEARSVYAEGLEKVSTVKDFGIVYQAYLTLEEGLLEAAVEAASNEDDDDEELMDDAQENTGAGEGNNGDDWDLLLPASKQASSGQLNPGNTTSASQLLTDMELAVARAEHLTARRPMLLNAVLLRQDPNNVGEWMERAKLYTAAKDDRAAVATLHKALAKIRRPVNGTPDQVVIQLASLYENQFSVEEADTFFNGICIDRSYPFTKTEHLAACWTAWVEFQMRLERWDRALELARQSIASGGRRDAKRIALQRSLVLWDLLLDLEESLGTVQTTKDAYNRALETKVATVQHVLNFATFLADQKYFEESFTAYERGVEMFAFPHAGAKLIWKAYLDAFGMRYEGSKVERSRDLFQRCLENCPPEESTPFFIMNGLFEEKYGLTKRSLNVYRSMTRKVAANEKLMAYQLYIAKTTKYLGVTATRDIYQEAIEQLEEIDSAKLCMEFAAMEASLQQQERARGVYAYGAQMADPRRLPEFYKDWNDFEIAHGNEETFREMLRIKRSVEAAFSTVNYNAAGMNEQVPNLSNEEAMEMIANREGDDMEATAVSGFVPSSSNAGSGASGAKRTAAVASLDDVEARVAKLRKATGVTGEELGDKGDDEDGDEIDIDDIDAEIEEAAAEGEAATRPPDSIGLSTKAVPAAVFGGLAK